VCKVFQEKDLSSDSFPALSTEARQKWPGFDLFPSLHFNRRVKAGNVENVKDGYLLTASLLGFRCALQAGDSV
jgi:hypothetical protein